MTAATMQQDPRSAYGENGPPFSAGDTAKLKISNAVNATRGENETRITAPCIGTICKLESSAVDCFYYSS